MSTSILYELRIHEYRGPKKHPMLTGSANKIILPLKIMAHTVIERQRAMHNAFKFFKDVISSENIPEFNGYNTKLCRLAGLSVSHCNKAVYMPLIDMSPVDHNTMMTALIEANRLTPEVGQEFTIFTTAVKIITSGYMGLSRAIFKCSTSSWWHAYAYEFCSCSGKSNGRKWAG